MLQRMLSRKWRQHRVEKTLKIMYVTMIYYPEQALTDIPLAMVALLLPFWKPLQCCLDRPHSYTTYWSAWDLSGSLLVHSSKSLVCHLRSGPCTHTAGVIPDVHSTFMWVAFSGSVLFLISLRLASSLELPLSVPHPESWGYSYLSLPHTSCEWRRVNEGWRHTRSNKDYPSLLGAQFLWSERKFPIPLSFQPQWPLLSPPLLQDLFLAHQLWNVVLLHEKERD